MDDGDYATSKHIWWHRCLSLGLVLAAAPFLEFPSSPILTIRFISLLVLPLSAIWFPDQLSYWAIRASGYWLNSSNSDVVLRIAGWLILILLLGLRLLRTFWAH